MSARPTRSSTRSGRARPRPCRARWRRCPRSGRLNDMTRLTPQSGGTLSFAGTDSRLNNITVDGSAFNNSFGLRNSPGDTAGVAPISLAAIEQLQVSIAPFDVRQGNFVGAAVNTVTRSGTNVRRRRSTTSSATTVSSAPRRRATTVNPGTFNFRNTGLWASGPIVKNRTSSFFNHENESFVQPGTTFRANRGGEAGRRQRDARPVLGSPHAQRLPENQLRLRDRALSRLRPLDAGEALSRQGDSNLNITTS